MAFYKPITPGRRQYSARDFSDLTKGIEPYKPLLEPLKSSGGRNNRGRITVRFRGGGHKRLYRVIDFKRNKVGKALVETIEYDPNRSVNIALVRFEDGERFYILAPESLKAGQFVESGPKSDIRPGCAMPLKDIPVGTSIHNIELKRGKGGALVRSAGASAQLIAKEEGLYVTVRLPSGEMRKILSENYASIGQLSNSDHMNISIGKAGRSRWAGRKPHNRGTSMNPVDHPHGGGEGRTAGGRHPVTPWGKPTKGGKTRHNKRTNRFIVLSRAKAKKSKA